jgi:hypothetical protein
MSPPPELIPDFTTMEPESAELAVFKLRSPESPVVDPEASNLTLPEAFDFILVPKVSVPPTPEKLSPECIVK